MNSDGMDSINAQAAVNKMYLDAIEAKLSLLD